MQWIRNLFGKKQEKTSRRAYAGAAHNRLTSDWVSSSSSQDSELLTSLRPLRNRSRQLCRDNDYARGAVRTIINNIVGKGMTLQAQVKKRRGDKHDEAINTAIEELWSDWCQAKYCHTAGKLCFSDIERLVMRSVVESGEVLIRLVPKAFAGSPVPLALEVIESDQLVDEYTSGNGTTGIIRMGVEVDEWQRPLAYWLYPHHPGDYQFQASSVGSRLLRVPSNEVLHLFLSDRPGQTRGVPWFHSALLRLRNVGGYEEAELVAARAQASVMGFIQSPDGELFGDGVEGSQRLTSLEPGAIEMLAPGEVFSGFAPTRPNMGFDPFVRMMLRGVATGIGMSYEALSRDYSNTSYSSARTALLDERDNYKIVQDWLIKNFHLPIYLAWLEYAVMSGALSLPGYELNPRFYQKNRWTARGWQWVDPQNEVAAYKEAIKAGFTTTSQVVAQSGLDIEDVLKERRRELDLAAEMDVAFDTTLEAAPEEQPEAKEGFTLVRTFALRAKKCTKGIACGDGCIAKNKVCQSTLDGPAKPKKTKAKKATAAPKADPAPKAPKTPKAPKAPSAPKTPPPPTPSPEDGADKGAIQPTLSPKPFNPHAMADLKIEDFAAFKDAEEFNRQFKDPQAIQNQDFDTWKGGDKFKTKPQYQLEIANALNEGIALEDDFLSQNSVKLTKKQISQNAKNRTEQESRDALVGKFRKAIDYPLVEDEIAASHKPSMTKEEADAYTKGTTMAGMGIYHGNLSKITDSITDEGAQPERNRRGIYGQGTYFAVSKEIAESYASFADENKDIGIVGSQVRLRNPYVSDTAQINSIGQNFLGSQDNGVDAESLTQFLRAKGHDGIYLKDYGYVVAFDGKQVVTFENEKIARGSPRDKALSKFTDMAQEAAANQKNPMVQKLGKMKSTESITYPKLEQDDDWL